MLEHLSAVDGEGVDHLLGHAVFDLRRADVLDGRADEDVAVNGRGDVDVEIARLVRGRVDRHGEERTDVLVKDEILALDAVRNVLFIAEHSGNLI